MLDAGQNFPEFASLGINAKSRDTPKGLKREKDPGLALPGRRNRLELTRASGSLLFDRALEHTPKEQFRVCWCHRGVQSRTGEATVSRRIDGGGARLGGVIRCGSVWLCPTCAKPVSEKRREELQLAMKRWNQRGGHVYLMTLTFSHDRDDDLADLMKRLEKAVEKFRTGRPYRSARDAYGVIGVVRGLEATHGQNGWHPHLHYLVFGKPGLLDDAEAIEKMNEDWVKRIVAAGLCPTSKIEDAKEIAFDIRGGDAAAEYMLKYGRDQKWGMSSEMTRHQAKIGARGLADFNGHVTPFQILDWASKGDNVAARLWRKFADVFHGKRQLVYSAGLKKELGIADLSDEEIANDDTPRPEEEQTGIMTRAQLAVLHSRRALGEFLELVGRYGGGQSDIDDWIEFIRTRPKEARGTLVDRGEYADWRQAR